MMLQGFIHAGQFRIRTRGIIYASATWKKNSAKYCTVEPTRREVEMKEEDKLPRKGSGTS
jgi:hypothetical protein